MILDITPKTLLLWRTIDEPLLYNFFCPWIYNYSIFIYDGFMRTEEDIERETPEESYHKKLGEMIKKVKAETKWRDIFKIVEEAQKRLEKEA